MHAYTLYGINVAADLPLLAGDCENSAIQENNGSILRVVSVAPGGLSFCRQLIDSLELPGGHQLLLFSDRETLSKDIGRPWCLEIKDVVRFSWIGGESILSYQILERGSALSMAYWCVHMVLPMFKAFTQGWHFFHASSIELEGSAVLFVAPSYGGKSTMVHHAVAGGCRLLSDDKALVRRESNGYFVVPSHPCSRPDRAVESLGSPVSNYSAAPTPLLAVYCLDSGDASSRVKIRELGSLQKVEALLGHHLYNFRSQRREQLSFVAGVAARVPVFTFTRPWGMEHIQLGLDELRRHVNFLREVRDG